MSSNLRLDQLMVARGLVQDTEMAKRYVLAGEVLLNGARATSAALKVPKDCDISLAHKREFVSRGGYKLQKALEVFPVHIAGATCLDCGASTGGFTDCLLQQGAHRVCAVDKGYGDFAWRLRNDDRVTLFERSDVRDFPADQGGAPFDMVVSDMSFIRLQSWLGAVVPHMTDEGVLITLVKPQFEVESAQVGTGGIVRQSRLHRQVLYDTSTCVQNLGLQVAGISFSPITGRAGNIEFLLCAAKEQYMKHNHLPALTGQEFEHVVEQVVSEAHAALGDEEQKA